MAISYSTNGSTNLSSASSARANAIGNVVKQLKDSGATEIYLHTQIYNGRFFVDGCGWSSDTKDVVTASADTGV